MGLSPQNFRRQIAGEVVELHWRHWTALGVAAHGTREETFLIDLEPLIASTALIIENDGRLGSSVREWLLLYGKWVNQSRLKRAVSSIHNPRLKKGSANVDGILHHPDQMRDVRDAHRGSQRTKLKTSFDFGNPAIRQLALRHILGINAGVEVMLFISSNKGGSSNAIANEILVAQNSVYMILEQWSKVGLTLKVERDGRPIYVMHAPQPLFDALGLRGIPRYLNWTKTFSFLWKVIDAIHAEGDTYLTASKFRDILSEARTLSTVLGLTVPSPAGYPGPQYFEPFASSVLQILERLKNPASGKKK